MSSKKIKLGISACLLGRAVRYDGGHRLDQAMIDALDRCVEWVPVCPEVESGLPVPRDIMRLVGDSLAPRLEIIVTGADYTEPILRWSEKKLKELEAAGLSGFIFKSRSPSCGIYDVPVFSNEGESVGLASGLFARAFMEAFPNIPVEDETRLSDEEVMKKFVERIISISSETFKQRRPFVSKGP